VSKSAVTQRPTALRARSVISASREQYRQLIEHETSVRHAIIILLTDWKMVDLRKQQPACSSRAAAAELLPRAE
jgi:hypothetical protein